LAFAVPPDEIMPSSSVRPGSSPFQFDPEQSVNAILARWPASIGALNALGIDTCCGGAESLRAASEAAGAPIELVIATIERALAAEVRT
jgi:iron-sulfur cluster repair protein YtfE (RIC family)